jgi:hypothetical protein
MASSSKIEIENFNWKIFQLWKLKMEYILVDKYQWIVMHLGIAPTIMSTKIGKNWIRRQREQSGCVSQIQYY